MAIRQPIVVVLGHVDSGKTSLLDKIRGTAVQSRESGGITQHIGASFFPTETLETLCGDLFTKFGREINLPGLLVIDTPGHAVFSNLRNRGGSAADIAILIVDIMKGFEPQTIESLDILRRLKVPFIVALNKLDTLPGWNNTSNSTLTQSLKNIDKNLSYELDNRIYAVVTELSKQTIQSEAYFRIKDPQKEVSIIPVSAKSGEGIPELLSFMIGLTQQYMHKKLQTTKQETRGIVLEIKEEPGLGDTANILLFEGQLNLHDHVILATPDGPLVTKVKAMFMPKALDEMRDPRDKFLPITEVNAAAGVKLVTTEIEGVIGGSPLFAFSSYEQAVDNQHLVESAIKSVLIEKDTMGVIVKADTLGSLEALIEILTTNNVSVKSADIGPVSKKDVIKASVVSEKDRYLGVILAFGVKISDDAREESLKRGIRIFSEPVLYDLQDNYINWVADEKSVSQRTELGQITLPCKFQIIKGMVFRNNSPAVFGVEISVGNLKSKTDVINTRGKVVGKIKQIQDNGQNIQEASTGSQVAVSMDGPVLGRTIHEGEFLYSLPNSVGVRLIYEKYLDTLNDMEKKVLDDILEFRRKNSPLYGF